MRWRDRLALPLCLLAVEGCTSGGTISQGESIRAVPYNSLFKVTNQGSFAARKCVDIRWNAVSSSESQKIACSMQCSAFRLVRHAGSCIELNGSRIVEHYRISERSGGLRDIPRNRFSGSKWMADSMIYKPRRAQIVSYGWKRINSLVSGLIVWNQFGFGQHGKSRDSPRATDVLYGNLHRSNVILTSLAITRNRPQQSKSRKYHQWPMFSLKVPFTLKVTPDIGSEYRRPNDEPNGLGVPPQLLGAIGSSPMLSKGPLLSVLGLICSFVGFVCFRSCLDVRRAWMRARWQIILGLTIGIAGIVIFHIGLNLW